MNNNRRIGSNDDIGRYLQRLSADLSSCNHGVVAKKVERASRFASGSPSEFLFEAEDALNEVRETCTDALSEMEAAQLGRVMKQIRDAFDEVGGA